jgi:Predicted nucleotide-binding protein containing TIR-like domain
MDSDTRWKVKILAPQSKNLSERQNAFLTALTAKLERNKLQVVPDSPSRASVEDRYKLICDCDGMIILAFGQWEGCRLGETDDDSAILPSEFTHIGIVQAALSKRPYLILREKSVAERGALRRNFALAPMDLPKSLDTDWLEADKFESEFQGWLKKVRARSHVFLGYSSQAATVANSISDYLTKGHGLKVHHWSEFAATESILDSIERAEKSTNCGIFLFMADDALSAGDGRQFAPRDNVVFEAGYFAGAKRRSRSLIIRERGAKIPTDLGGIIDLEIDSRENIDNIKPSLSRYIARMLSGDD